MFRGGTIVQLVLLASLTAGAEGLRDYSSHSPPQVHYPPAGGSYVDPVFGTTILRITDERDGTECVHAYSYWPAFNVDDTRLLLACDDEALLYRFDTTTDHATKDGTLRGTDGPSVEFDGATWSHSDPNVIYALGSTKLWRIDVSKRGSAGYTLVKDFAGLFTYPFYLAQLQVSADDNVFTFHARNPSTDAHLDAVVFDRQASKTRVFDRQGFSIDETGVDKLGDTVLIYGTDGTFKLWDFRGGRVSSFGMDENDMPGGHMDLGRLRMVNSDGWDTGLVVRSYTNPRGTGLRNIVQYQRPDGSLNWTIADHVSMRTDDETFVIGSTYSGDGTWGAFEKEIYLAYTDGSGFVRLAHTRSETLGPDSDWQYWTQPRAVVDRRGHYVVYTSNLGSSSRMDVFILKIPQSLWPAVAAPPPETGVPDAGVAPPPGTGVPDAAPTTGAGASGAGAGAAPDTANAAIEGGCAVGGGGGGACALIVLLALAIANRRRFSS